MRTPCRHVGDANCGYPRKRRAPRVMRNARQSWMTTMLLPKLILVMAAVQDGSSSGSTVRPAHGSQGARGLSRRFGGAGKKGSRVSGEPRTHARGDGGHSRSHASVRGLPNLLRRFTLRDARGSSSKVRTRGVSSVPLTTEWSRSRCGSTAPELTSEAVWLTRA